MKRLVIVTGLSGAGKSQAMKSFEDAGFACLDNVPPVLAVPYVELVERSGRLNAAIALDVRSGGAFGTPAQALYALQAAGFAPELLFLDADDATLVRRYSETRRRHPHADATNSLSAAIAAEREALSEVRDRADIIWDTTHFTQSHLKEQINLTFVENGADQTHVSVIAFGFKYGIPIDADWTIDVRFLPNPHYDPNLRALSGHDQPVITFLESIPDLQPFLDRLNELFDFVIPRAKREGKSQFTLAVGCTGGRHRSVYIAQRLAEHLRAQGFAVGQPIDRDLAR